MSRHRWLLLLGSNLADDHRILQALERLQALGVTTALTPVRQFPPQDGVGAAYFNALAELTGGQSREALSRGLKTLEAELGRKHDDHRVVAIDIDILAVREKDCWRPDAHALAKGEFDRAVFKSLLQLTGQRVCPTPAH